MGWPLVLGASVWHVSLLISVMDGTLADRLHSEVVVDGEGLIRNHNFRRMCNCSF